MRYPYDPGSAKTASISFDIDAGLAPPLFGDHFYRSDRFYQPIVRKLCKLLYQLELHMIFSHKAGLEPATHLGLLCPSTKPELAEGVEPS